MAKIKYEITVAELRAAYLSYCEKCTDYACFCWVLMDLVAGYAPINSQSVIEQFVRAKPERFVVGGGRLPLIPSMMKAKYRYVRDPRLSLLNSMPDDYILEFEMRAR